MDDKIKVRFTGICTHILSGLGPHARHRTVLVRADHGANILGHAIPPHIPRLRIADEDIVAIEGNLAGLQELAPRLWQIAGAGLQLEGVADERYAPEESYHNEVPRLRSQEGKLDTVSQSVVVHECAAGYFDVYGGVLQATKTAHGAVGTELTATIAGEPRLKVTCFWSRQASWITLRPGATVHVEHTGTLLGDANYDFLLHYLIFSSIPDDVEIPEEAKNKKMLLRTNPGDISAGCSNSQYP